ncbi:MAG: putative sulfate exporter family transporter [Oligoflexales bacterium]|nr:putative sulfate exporter family transporter [Oligoflexales bacterium]
MYIPSDSFSMLTRIGPGLILCTGIALGAELLANWVPTMGGVSIAILLGMLWGNIQPVTANLEAGVSFAEKKLLSYSIVLMGFGLEWAQIKSLGNIAFLIIISAVVLTIGTSYLISKAFRLSPSLGLLLGVGNAICGSAAVVASAPLVTKDNDEVGISVSIVNLLGTLGIFILPALVKAGSFTEQTASLFVGGTLQAVGHVVAAGYAINSEVGELSLAIKMGRICLLIPALLVLAYFSTGSSKSKNTGSLLGLLPTYLYGFMLCTLILNSGYCSPEFVSLAKKASNVLLVISMSAIGTRIRIATLINCAPKALLVGAATFFCQIVFFYGVANLYE